MAISVSIELSADEKKQLAAILGTTAAKLDEALVSFGKAALEEYVRMFLGQRVFTRGSDAREFRLHLLIKHAFDNRFPDDQRISDLFQTTLSESRSLIKSVSAKYQYELAGAKEATLKEVLGSAVQRDDTWLLSINSRTVVEQLNLQRPRSRSCARSTDDRGGREHGRPSQCRVADSHGCLGPARALVYRDSGHASS